MELEWSRFWSGFQPWIPSFEVFHQHPSGDMDWAVGLTSLELRGEVSEWLCRFGSVTVTQRGSEDGEDFHSTARLGLDR